MKKHTILCIWGFSIALAAGVSPLLLMYLLGSLSR